MDHDLAVRRFVASDAEALTALLHAAYAELGAQGLNFTAVDQSVETTTSRALAGHCFVVEREGELVATLTMSFPLSDDLQARTAAARVADRAWLNQVAVSPFLRGQGIAAHLWRLGQDWARSQGATSVGVDTAEPAEHLVALYSAWGFERVDTIHWDGKTYESVIMVREL